MNYEFAIRDTISVYKLKIQDVKNNEPEIIKKQNTIIDSLKEIIKKIKG